MQTASWRGIWSAVRTAISETPRRHVPLPDGGRPAMPAVVRLSARRLRKVAVVHGGNANTVEGYADVRGVAIELVRHAVAAFSVEGADLRGECIVLKEARRVGGEVDAQEKGVRTGGGGRRSCRDEQRHSTLGCPRSHLRQTQSGSRRFKRAAACGVMFCMHFLSLGGAQRSSIREHSGGQTGHAEV